MTTGRFRDDWTMAQYYDDPCATPSLSASIAGDIVLGSARHAHSRHPRLGGEKFKPTVATNNGTVLHTLLLGKGKEQLAVLAVDDFRTKAAKEARDAALDAGKTVVKEDDYNEASKTAEKLKKTMADDYGIVLDGQSEQKIEFYEDTEEGPIVCRSMIDHIKISFDPVPHATVYDLKTIRSADVWTCRRHTLEYGYDIQDAAYRSAIAKAVPEVVGRIDFVFVFMECDPPFVVTPLCMTGMWRELAFSKWANACRTWARCLKTNRWPAYVDKIESMEPPPWALTGN